MTESQECPEESRLSRAWSREADWLRWGTYLPERQWSTVREDYSVDGACWEYFTHDHARSRAYRWGEDGLFGLTDRKCRLCFAWSFWNERDDILKERLFGVTGNEGNHGEDVKEVYYYTRSTPTHSYMSAEYKMPFFYPYAELVTENKRRGRTDREYEITDTGVFDEGHWSMLFEYCKESPNDILIRLTATNVSEAPASVHVLPTGWFRNTWSWGENHDPDERWERPCCSLVAPNTVRFLHGSLGDFDLHLQATDDVEWLFTENDTNTGSLYGASNAPSFTKDAFHRFVVNGDRGAVNGAQCGTKAAAHLVFRGVSPGESVSVKLRLVQVGVEPQDSPSPFENFDALFRVREQECAEFYAQSSVIPEQLSAQERELSIQALSSLLWSKKFYYYVVDSWLEGDPGQPAPPEERKCGRNSKWRHFHARDVISLPDAWEYPWPAVWDLAFHLVVLARVDLEFAKGQLILFMREWYMGTDGSLPAYEFALDDVNPPVHCWAVWKVYRYGQRQNQEDRQFLAAAFHKLLLNFTYWVNRKDPEGNNVFSGGFLGLDNIGVFDRSAELPSGGVLLQADGTSWMALYCITMFKIALELATESPEYADIASKFFEHFVHIGNGAMESLGGIGLWDDEDKFFYDVLKVPNADPIFLKVRSLVGLAPFFATGNVPGSLVDHLPTLHKRTQWFLDNSPLCLDHLIQFSKETNSQKHLGHTHRIMKLSLLNKSRMEEVFNRLFDPNEFLSPYGIRSLSKVYETPYNIYIEAKRYSIKYVAGESETGMFGGNSSWRGPVWFPMNWLLIESLERLHNFYGNEYTTEYPRGSGHMLTLAQITADLCERLSGLFLAPEGGQLPCLGQDAVLQRFQRPLFFEYFDPETGRGLGASHQTGWTALVVLAQERVAHHRSKTK